MWSDKESDKDYLNFGEVSQLVVDILTSPEMLPVSIGIFGNWGAGKSSLLKLIEHDLHQKEEQKLVIQFDAWLYQGYDDARAALLEVISRELHKAADGNQGLLKKTAGLLDRVNGVRALGLLAEGAALMSGVPTGGLLSRGVSAVGGLFNGVQSQEECQEITGVVKDVKVEAEGLIKPAKKMTPPQQIDAFRKQYKEILEDLKMPVIVTIDNLDRCLPINAIHTLEAIRLFLFLPNTAFIIAADEEMIRTAVAEHFKGASSRHQIDYLDKLIQIPIRVPKAGVREIRSYLFLLFAINHRVHGTNLEQLRQGLERSLQQSWQADPISTQDALALTGKTDDADLARAYDLADRIAPTLATSPIIHGNPRIVKRLLNVVKMRSQIAKRQNMPLDESMITKLVIFERCAGAEATTDLYKLIDQEAGKPAILVKLEEGIESEDFPTNAPSSWISNPTTKEFIQSWAKLEPSLKRMDLRAAIYLSRETMPIGAYVVGLSPRGKEILSVLVATSNVSSPEGVLSAKGIPLVEQVPIMEGLIEHLRQVTDWSKQPSGFAGAYLLAEQSPTAAMILVRFIGGLGSKKPWMTAMLKNKNWYTE